MADLTIELRQGLAAASVMARKGVDPAAIGAVLGVAMPTGPRAVLTATRAILGTGPATWLVFGEEMDRDLTGLASVSDQSGSYLVHRLSGTAARTLLQRGAAIDLHPDAFRPGSAATTVIAHIGVILWQIDDAPSYDIAIFRSYASSFRHWLDTIAATL